MNEPDDDDQPTRQSQNLAKIVGRACDEFLRSRINPTAGQNDLGIITPSERANVTTAATRGAVVKLERIRDPYRVSSHSLG